MKLFKTNNALIIEDCRMYFNLKLPIVYCLLQERKVSWMNIKVATTVFVNGF